MRKKPGNCGLKFSVSACRRARIASDHKPEFSGPVPPYPPTLPAQHPVPGTAVPPRHMFTTISANDSGRRASAFPRRRRPCHAGPQAPRARSVEACLATIGFGATRPNLPRSPPRASRPLPPQACIFPVRDVSPARPVGPRKQPSLSLSHVSPRCCGRQYSLPPLRAQGGKERHAA